MSDSKRLTTASGIPVADNQNSISAGTRGPLPLQDFHLLEKLQHFNRERIPERVVHAKGSGAYGTFTVTHDITRFTKAKLFASIGKTTETFVRFSTLHRGRQLGPGRQQHADVLHQGPHQVPGLRAHTKARPANQPEVADDDVGLLVESTRVAAPGDDAVL